MVTDAAPVDVNNPPDEQDEPPEVSVRSVALDVVSQTYFEQRLPDGTFWDKEDGGMASLRMSVISLATLRSDSWLRIRDGQVLYGVPPDSRLPRKDVSFWSFVGFFRCGICTPWFSCRKCC